MTGRFGPQGNLQRKLCSSTIPVKSMKCPKSLSRPACDDVKTTLKFMTELSGMTYILFLADDKGCRLYRIHRTDFQADGSSATFSLAIAASNVWMRPTNSCSCRSGRTISATALGRESLQIGRKHKNVQMIFVSVDALTRRTCYVFRHPDTMMNFCFFDHVV